MHVSSQLMINRSENNNVRNNGCRKKCFSDMIIVTDGIVGIKNAHTLDSIIQQLRATTVACSFLRVGSGYDPHCADGLVPYEDLLYFIAAATLGSYMSFSSYVVREFVIYTHIRLSTAVTLIAISFVFFFSPCEQIPAPGTDVNLCHKTFLFWQLYRDISNNDMAERHSWRTENKWFHDHKTGQLLKKKQIDDKVTCTLSSLLCCRLREGYLIKRVSIRDDTLEIIFVLLWKTNVFLEYLITCPWSSKSLSVSNTIQYTITIEGRLKIINTNNFKVFNSNFCSKIDIYYSALRIFIRHYVLNKKAIALALSSRCHFSFLDGNNGINRKR